MAIDFAATQHNLRNVNLASLAREEGVIKETLHRFVYDVKYPKNGPKSPLFLEILRKHGYLVEVLDEEEQAA